MVVYLDTVEVKIKRSGLCRELFGQDALQEHATNDATTVDLVVNASLKRHGGDAPAEIFSMPLTSPGLIL